MGQWEDLVTFYILDTQSTREVGTITTDCDRKSPAHGPPSPAAAVGLVRLFSKLGTGGDPGPNCATGAGLFHLESLRLFSSETGVIIVHTPLVAAGDSTSQCMWRSWPRARHPGDRAGVSGPSPKERSRPASRSGVVLGALCLGPLPPLGLGSQV